MWLDMFALLQWTRSVLLRVASAVWRSDLCHWCFCKLPSLFEVSLWLHPYFTAVRRRRRANSAAADPGPTDHLYILRYEYMKQKVLKSGFGLCALASGCGPASPDQRTPGPWTGPGSSWCSTVSLSLCLHRPINNSWQCCPVPHYVTG